jgi:hypothetical protein
MRGFRGMCLGFEYHLMMFEDYFMEEFLSLKPDWKLTVNEVDWELTFPLRSEAIHFLR